MSQLEGRTLGHYRLLEELGRGGMATVYKAYQPSLDRHVAVKILAPFLANQRDFFERFRREATAVARLSHPNILNVYDFGQEGDLAYIVMEYVVGGNLAGRLGSAKDLAFASVIIAQMASALDYAHRRGIIHRDIKPANILMAEDDWAILSDFGIAKIVESTLALTQTGMGIGTPEYMSPEQGQGLAIDQRTDIYSLGVVLYEILTGKVPYRATTPIAVVMKHISEPLPPPRSLNPAIPEEVEQVIARALAKDPAQRYASALEMSHHLVHAAERAGQGGVTFALPRSQTAADRERLSRLAELYEAARKAEAAGQLHQAVEILSQIQRIEPAYRDVAEMIAGLQSREMASDQRSAEVDLQSLYEQGLTHFSQRRWAEALEFLTRVAASDPFFADVQARISDARQRLQGAPLPQPPVTWERPDNARQNAVLLPVIGLLAFLLLVGGGLGGWLAFRGPAPNSTPTPTAEVVASGDGTPEVTAVKPTKTPIEGPTREPTSAPTEVVAGRSYPDGRIAYLDDKPALWVANPDGSDAGRLTDGGNNIGSAAWSPDGRTLAFEMDYNIWKINVDGSGLTQLSDQGKSVAEYETIAADSPRWSRQGDKVAYRVMNDSSDKSVSPGLWVVDASGDNRRYLGDADFVEGWSPSGAIAISKLVLPSDGGDGRWVAFVVDPATGESKQLVEGTQLSFSPDGQSLAYQGDPRDGSRLAAIYLADADGSNARSVTDFYDAQWPSWSPDGRHLAFTVGAKDTQAPREIYVMNSGGGGQRRVANGDLWTLNPWSPDSQSIIFEKQTDSNREVRVVGIDGASERKLVDGQQPAWSPAVGGSPSS